MKRWSGPVSHNQSDADSVKSRNRCSLARSASSARFWSSMSVSVPYHFTMFPSSSRSGWARLRNQRYSPSALQIIQGEADFPPTPVDEIQRAVGQSTPDQCRNRIDGEPKFPLRLLGNDFGPQRCFRQLAGASDQPRHRQWGQQEDDHQRDILRQVDRRIENGRGKKVSQAGNSHENEKSRCKVTTEQGEQHDDSQINKGHC